MKAILVNKPGGIEELQIGELATPEPREQEVLVRVRAAALNRADILQRKGYYPPPPGASDILGLEFAGEIVALGANCHRLSIGDRVCGLLAGGGYAQYAAIHEQMAMPIPENANDAEAAAIPEAFLTAFHALFLLGNLQTGQRVLIHAGASGVGTASIQLAREIGAEIFVTASREKKLLACKRLGAKHLINYQTDDFAAVVQRVTNGRGVDLVIDFIGATYFSKNLQCLGLDGRLVLLSLLSGQLANEIDLRLILSKRLQIVGSTLRNRSIDEKIRLTQAFWQFAGSKWQAGILRPVIDRVYDWRAVQDAHALMEANENIGKIVLNVTD